MRRLYLEIIAAAALTLAAIMTFAPGVLANDVLVIDGFARASATPLATSAAAYLTVTNHGTESDRLTSIATGTSAMAQLHESKSADGVASMAMVETLEIAPGQTVTMAPGGLHIMLMGLPAPLKKGGKISLELNFEKAGKVIVSVPVGGIAATSSTQASGG